MENVRKENLIYRIIIHFWSRLCSTHTVSNGDGVSRNECIYQKVQAFKHENLFECGMGMSWCIFVNGNFRNLIPISLEVFPTVQQGAVSIRKTVLPGMAIPMLKIRRPNGRLIFNMEIAIRR